MWIVILSWYASRAWYFCLLELYSWFAMPSIWHRFAPWHGWLVLLPLCTCFYMPWLFKNIFFTDTSLFVLNCVQPKFTVKRSKPFYESMSLCFLDHAQRKQFEKTLRLVCAPTDPCSTEQHCAVCTKKKHGRSATARKAHTLVHCR